MKILKILFSLVLVSAYWGFSYYVDNLKPDAEFGKIEYYNELQSLYYCSPIMVIALILLVFRKELKNLLK